jgi:hypothetical protein
MTVEIKRVNQEPHVVLSLHQRAGDPCRAVATIPEMKRPELPLGADSERLWEATSNASVLSKTSTTASLSCATSIATTGPNSSPQNSTVGRPRLFRADISINKAEGIVRGPR